METETIDKLFLELSQLTQAETEKETLLRGMIRSCMLAFERIIAVDDFPRAHAIAKEQNACIQWHLDHLTNK